MPSGFELTTKTSVVFSPENQALNCPIKACKLNGASQEKLNRS